MPLIGEYAASIALFHTDSSKGHASMQRSQFSTFRNTSASGILLAATLTLGFFASQPATAQKMPVNISGSSVTGYGTDPDKPGGDFGSASITPVNDNLTFTSGQTIPDVDLGTLTLDTGDIPLNGVDPAGQNEYFDFYRNLSIAGVPTSQEFIGQVATSDEYSDPFGNQPYTDWNFTVAPTTISLGSLGSLQVGEMDFSGADGSMEYATEIIPLTADVTFVAPSPEPSAVAALGLGALGLGALGIKARKRKA